jgi:SAM-dependent methyltransferase
MKRRAPVRLCAILDFLEGSERARSSAARAVEAFYDRRPFPGYAPGDDAAALVDRSRRSPFLRALDVAIDPAATVLDAGCGTAQLAAFLALAGPKRTVVAADSSRRSLRAAEEFQKRSGIPNVHLVRADLFALPLAREAFDVVVCRGVVHHTEDPARAVREVAARVRGGGVLVLAFYESWARLPHRLRRALARAIGRPVRALDPVLRRRDLDPEKARTWIEDQYRHPLERALALPEVLRWLRSSGITWLSTVPPLPAGSGLFDETPEPGWAALAARRIGTAIAGARGEDAGLVCVVAGRQPRS